MDTENRSYFYATIDGWGHRSFFTYFSEFRRSWTAAGAIEAAILSAIFVASVLANTAIIYVVLKHRPLQTVTNYFIANLAIADLTFTVSIPLVAVIRIIETWVLGDVVCRLMLYFQCVCGAVLIWSLTLISIDRYRCIVVPPLRPRMTPRHALCLITAMWLFFFLMFIPVAVWFQVMEFPFEHSTVQVCTLVFPYIPPFRVSIIFIVIVLISAGIIPTILLIFNYNCIFRQLVGSQRKWQSQSQYNNVDTLFHSECPTSTPFRCFSNMAACSTQSLVDVQSKTHKMANSMFPLENLDASSMPPSPLTRAKSILYTSDGESSLEVPVTMVACSRTKFLNFKLLFTWRKCNTANACSGTKDNRQHSEHSQHGQQKPYSNPTMENVPMSSATVLPTLNIENARWGRHYRAVKILVLDVVIVLLMWLPLMAMLCVIYVDGADDGAHALQSHHFVYCLFVAFANTCVNPILYGILNDNFRRCFTNAWQHLWQRCQIETGNRVPQTSIHLTSVRDLNCYSSSGQACTSTQGIQKAASTCHANSSNHRYDISVICT